MAELAGTILVVLFSGLLLGCFVLWFLAGQRVASGLPLLPLEPRRPVPWGLFDLVAIAFIVFVMLGGAMSWAARVYEIPADVQTKDLTAPQLAGFLLADTAGKIAAFVLSMGWLMARGANATDLGINLRRLPGDLVLGAKAFTMIAPPMFLLQAALTFFFPSEHPLQTLLEKQPSVQLFALAGLTAIAVAPLCEEFLFRTILQGWLENFSLLPKHSEQLLNGGSNPQEHDDAAEHRGQEDFPAPSDREGSLEKPSETGNPYQTPSVQHSGESPAGQVSKPGAFQPMFWPWPVLISAGVFAAMHLGHGPDPIPLFLLAIGLGYVYHHTHRVLPCIVVHFLVNSFSMLALWVHLLTQQA